MTGNASADRRQVLSATRDGLHVIAEHVLAAAQYRDTGSVRLRCSPDGFAMTNRLHTGQHLAVAGDRLVVTQHDVERSTRITTAAAAAVFASVEIGMPASAYPAATELRPEAPLHIDAHAARELAGWFALADAALRRLVAQTTGAIEPVLWPEHFDIGITVEAVNYGASPGDDLVDEPYLYVGPHDGPPVRDEFWNAPFGAARARHGVATAQDAVEFYRAGRMLAQSRRARAL
jgi:hypothetical protein